MFGAVYNRNLKRYDVAGLSGPLQMMLTSMSSHPSSAPILCNFFKHIKLALRKQKSLRNILVRLDHDGYKSLS